MWFSRYGSRGRILVSYSGPIGWINLDTWLPKLPAAEGALPLPAHSADLAGTSTQ